jgi:hypothetical protein
MYPYRIFVSYSHLDRETADGVAAHLRDLGLRPFSDIDFKFGEAFHELIREHILSAHIFMPLMTDSSIAQPWIHQEAGFAIGSSIAVLPVLLGRRSDSAGLTSQIQGVQLFEDLSNIRERLTVDLIEDFSTRVREPEFAIYQTATEPDRRLELMIERAVEVLRWGYFGRVRESSTLSSFSFPDAPLDSTVWDQCEGKSKKPTQLRRLHRELRRSLERHVREEGCDLLLCPQDALLGMDLDSWRSRLGVLKDFLQSMPEGKVRLALRPRPAPTNQLLIGDWFGARSTANTMGAYTETMITKHSFVVKRQISLFQAELEQYAIEGGDQPYRLPTSLMALADIEKTAIQGDGTRVPRRKVFISSKSEDYRYAGEIYDALVALDIDVFFSEKSLSRLGESDYRKAIDKALDQADHLVVVASRKENLIGGWVEDEWGFFVNEIRSKKKSGNIVTVTAGELQPRDLPPSLRYRQAVPYGPELGARVVQYLR